MNYFIWLRGTRGPEPQLHLIDPRSLNSWKILETSIIAIVELKVWERDYTLAQAIAAYPCPVVA
jgi:hypothetical protein